MNTDVPVLVLKLQAHGGIGVVRTLGRVGVPVYVVHVDARAPAAASRYITGLFEYDLDAVPDSEALGYLITLARRIGRRPILISSDDAGERFVARHAEVLHEHFTFPLRPPGLSERLMSKRGLYEACREHGVPTPSCTFPQSREEALEALARSRFPLLVKAIENDRIARRRQNRMVIARDRSEAIDAYAKLEDPETPNLMLQEYIPGGSESVWVFTGYFDAGSECRFGAGGLKLRQFPIRTGTTCFGVVRSDPAMEAMTRSFVKRLDYRGVFDCGYRYDRREGVYKMLDVNPRVGMNFRQCVGRDGLDVVRAMYLDLTSQEIPADRPAEGRLWWVEDYDLRAGIDLIREGALSPRRWVGSVRHAHERAWYARDDLAPIRRLSSHIFRQAARRALRREDRPRRAQPALREPMASGNARQQEILQGDGSDHWETAAPERLDQPVSPSRRSFAEQDPPHESD